MSIVRVGLAETKKFAEGYDAIFGKKKQDQEQAAERTTQTARSKQPARGKAAKKGQAPKAKAKTARSKTAKKPAKKK